ncbi:hypothetical protein A4G99_04045 [Haladaptatus sp. R4]|nr:hypothetical protein A4G99_04045 [Haladaptatus sp. R4]
MSMTETRDGEDETRIAHLSGWFRRRPTSMEYWELLVTEERLVWCFVGESFKSMLLRADTGERGRGEIEDATPDRALSLDERNFAVPLDSLESVRLRDGTLFRRAKLVVTWKENDEADSYELYATKTADSQVDDVEALADDPRLSHVDVGVETTDGLF